MTLLYERQRRNIYLFFFFFWKLLQIFANDGNWLTTKKKKKKKCIKYFPCWFFGELYYTYLLSVRLCQDATSDVLNSCRYFRGKIFSIRVEVMEKEGIFGYCDTRSFVNFNKWRRNGEEWERERGRMERENGSQGRNFMAWRYFIRRLKFCTRGEARKRKYHSFELRFQRIFHQQTHILLRCLFLLARSFLPPFYIVPWNLYKM